MSVAINIPSDRDFDLLFDNELSSEEFAGLCSKNPHLIFSREEKGKISVTLRTLEKLK